MSMKMMTMTVVMRKTMMIVTTDTIADAAIIVNAVTNVMMTMTKMNLSDGIDGTGF